jgi:AcrR family transcriptional regulator
MVMPGDTSPRQTLTKRQAATVAELLDAGLAVLRNEGYDDLTLRTVAARANVTHTTAYNYFTSKAHLVAEILWRQLANVPHPAPNPRARLGVRVSQALRGPDALFGSEPALAEAALKALLQPDPEVRRLRDAIGGDLVRRLQVALGPDANPAVVQGLLLALSGAMLQAGMGYFGFEGVVERIASLATLLERVPQGATK